MTLSLDRITKRWIRGDADKSLARPGRKQATATKLGIYSTYSPRSSIHFLVLCSNFCKPLKKKNSDGCPSNLGLRGSNDLRVGRKMANFQMFFFYSREHVVVRRGQIPRKRVGDQDMEAQVGQFLLGCNFPVSRGIVVQEQDPLCDLSVACVFPSECPSIAPAEMSNTPRWLFGPLEDNQWGGCHLDPKKSRREFSSGFLHSDFFGGGVSRYAAIPLTVALSPGHSDITMFRPWSSITTGNHLDRAETTPNSAQTTGTVDVFGPLSGISGPTSRRFSACPNLHEWWTQPANVRYPDAQLLI